MLIAWFLCWFWVRVQCPLSFVRCWLSIDFSTESVITTNCFQFIKCFRSIFVCGDLWRWLLLLICDPLYERYPINGVVAVATHSRCLCGCCCRCCCCCFMNAFATSDAGGFHLFTVFPITYMLPCTHSRKAYEPYCFPKTWICVVKWNIHRNRHTFFVVFDGSVSLLYCLIWSKFAYCLKNRMLL